MFVILAQLPLLLTLSSYIHVSVNSLDTGIRRYDERGPHVTKFYLLGTDTSIPFVVNHNDP